jgi:Fur family ferric uptake transcriptional regulator
MSHCLTIIEDLRQKGYRITPQREMIIESIAHSESHMSADEIFSKLQTRTRATNIATVYRTLEMLWEEGLACRNDLGSGRIVYATLQHGPHIHLVCRYCSDVMDANPLVLQQLQSELNGRYQFEADLEHISVFGVCSACQSQQKGPDEA